MIEFNHIAGVIRALAEEEDTLASKTTDVIRDAAKGFAPVDTGHLRLSIESHKLANGKWEVIASTSPSGESIPGGTNREYAAYVEFGTVHNHWGNKPHPPRPYMMPAFVVGKGYAESVLRAEFAARIDRAARG